jgi:hypothetical protein
MIIEQPVALTLLAAAVALSIAGSAPAQQAAQAAVPIRTDEVPAEDLAAAVKDPNWKAPRTSWGDPALEGIWNSDDNINVPRERPETLGTRERLTQEEFAERAQKEAAFRNRILNQESWYSRSWSTRTFGYSSQIIDPPNGRMPEKTATAVPQRTRGSYSGGPYDTFEDFNLYDRCITRGMSSLIPSPARYGNGIHISQSPDAVTITYEMVHETRVIPLHRAAKPDANARQYLGVSRGHFEGDTLVIETEGFTDKTNIGNVHNSTAMRLTERLRRVDPEMIEYIGTVNDPLTFKAPFTYRLMITSNPAYQEVFEYSCHEGNSVMEHGLAGEREFERQVAAALARGEKPPEHERRDGLGPLPTDGSAFLNVNEEE